MKTTSSVRFIAALLLALQLLMLAACANTSNIDTDTTQALDADTTAPGGTEKNDAGHSLLSDDGAAKYSIVRPDSAGKDLVSAVAGFRNTLASAGVDAKLMTDWVKNTEEIDNEAYEILVGGTNREASNTEGMSLKDYYIDIVGNKIVICGGSDEASVTALEYFVANCLVGTSVVIAERIEHKESYTGANFTVAGVPIAEYTIVYSSSYESELGIDVANALQKMIKDTAGVSLPTRVDTKAASEYEIVIGPAKREYSEKLNETPMGEFYYRMDVSGKKIYFVAGGCFGLQYCVRYLKENYLEKGLGIDEGFTTSGSMYGKQVFDLEPGAEVRIMSNNVWQCDNNRPEWAAIGEDCSAEVRTIGLCATYMAYYPDIICFQEMSIKMIGLILAELKKNGYSYSLLSYTKGTDADNTCIIYRNDRLTLLDKGYHEFTYGNNGGSKSYTWGHFKMNSTGKDFVALSTHLWWKSESAQSGSDKMRKEQAAEIVKKSDILQEQFNCPIFAMGDFNTRTTTEAFKVLLDGGFKNTYDLATVFADNHRGRHTCGPEDTFARETAPGTYKADAIDHILLRNGGDTKILVFNHARPYFYIKLSDHYPVFVDAFIGE